MFSSESLKLTNGINNPYMQKIFNNLSYSNFDTVGKKLFISTYKALAINKDPLDK